MCERNTSEGWDQKYIMENIGYQALFRFREKKLYVLNVEYGIDLIKFSIIMIYRYLCRNFGGGHRYIFFDRKMMMIIYNI